MYGILPGDYCIDRNSLYQEDWARAIDLLFYHGIHAARYPCSHLFSIVLVVHLKKIGRLLYNIRLSVSILV